MRSKFTGQERDAETGLDFFQARYHGSAQGRFLSADPVGNFVADPTKPQELEPVQLRLEQSSNVHRSEWFVFAGLEREFL
jgi:hypothetical protein